LKGEGRGAPSKGKKRKNLSNLAGEEKGERRLTGAHDSLGALQHRGQFSLEWGEEKGRRKASSRFPASGEPYDLAEYKGENRENKTGPVIREKKKREREHIYIKREAKIEGRKGSNRRAGKKRKKKCDAGKKRREAFRGEENGLLTISRLGTAL